MRGKKISVIIFGFIFLISLPLFSQVNEFRIIFLEFSDNIKPQAFHSGFSYKKWRSGIKNVRNPRNLRRLLLKFESGLRNNVKKNEWNSIFPKWKRRLSRAVSVSELSEALYRLEINIRWDATFPGWQKQRRGWVKKIQSLY